MLQCLFLQICDSRLCNARLEELLQLIEGVLKPMQYIVLDCLVRLEIQIDCLLILKIQMIWMIYRSLLLHFHRILNWLLQIVQYFLECLIGFDVHYYSQHFHLGNLLPHMLRNRRKKLVVCLQDFYFGKLGLNFLHIVQWNNLLRFQYFAMHFVQLGILLHPLHPDLQLL